MWHITYIRSHFNHYRSLYQIHIVARALATRSLNHCRKCNALLSHGDILRFFCKTCQWPVESKQLAQIDPFDMFKVSKVYNVDKGKLNQQFRSYQFVLHPDRHASKSEEELELINSNSSIVNGHYRTLLDDKSRAKLLYCIKYGEEVLPAQNDSYFAQKFKTEVDKSDPAMLANIMDVHESVHTLENSEEAENMRKEFQQVISKTVEELGIAFERDDYQGVMTHFKTLSFYKQLLEKVQEFSGKD